MKYVLHAGYVYSKNDGDRHWVSAIRLMGLYRLKGRDCVRIESERDEREKLRGVNPDELIHLYPRPDGDYSLPA